jgi:hypothetical protein
VLGGALLFVACGLALRVRELHELVTVVRRRFQRA